MPYYPGLWKREFKGRRSFVAKKLLHLREVLDQQTTEKVLEGCLTVATWNLRDFGRAPGSGFNPEHRLPECFYYIAEILNRFDIIAVQEVNENLKDFEKLMDVLGKRYDFIFTDVTEGRGGNGERMVFIYDTRKVSFTKMAGEIVLPGSATQFARTPFVVSFQSAWLKFDICTAHLYYGADSGEKKQRRVAEIRALGEFMRKRAEKYDTNTFILGDFNVVDPQDDTWKALEETGFTMPEQIANLRTNVGGNKHYDQIAFYSARGEVELLEGEKCAGAFRFFDTVFDRPQDYTDIAKALEPGVEEFNRWRTWQMSDHLPLWVQVKTDFTEKYLQRVADSSGSPSPAPSG
jgi:exonuclease III